MSYITSALSSADENLPSHIKYCSCEWNKLWTACWSTVTRKLHSPITDTIRKRVPPNEYIIFSYQWLFRRPKHFSAVQWSDQLSEHQARYVTELLLYNQYNFTSFCWHNSFAFYWGQPFFRKTWPKFIKPDKFISFLVQFHVAGL